MLVSWLPRLTMRRRLELGHQWLAYVAASRLELAPAGDPAARARFKGSPRAAWSAAITPASAACPRSLGP
jgi:hypothetical protein